MHWTIIFYHINKYVHVYLCRFSAWIKKIRFTLYITVYDKLTHIYIVCSSFDAILLFMKYTTWVIDLLETRYKLETETWNLKKTIQNVYESVCTRVNVICYESKRKLLTFTPRHYMYFLLWLVDVFSLACNVLNY